MVFEPIKIQAPSVGRLITHLRRKFDRRCCVSDLRSRHKPESRQQSLHSVVFCYFQTTRPASSSTHKHRGATTFIHFSSSTTTDPIWQLCTLNTTSQPPSPAPSTQATRKHRIHSYGRIHIHFHINMSNPTLLQKKLHTTISRIQKGPRMSIALAFMPSNPSLNPGECFKPV